MPECDHFVNVVRLLVPSAETTAEMHRRAQENLPQNNSKQLQDLNSNIQKCKIKNDDQNKESTNSIGNCLNTRINGSTSRTSESRYESHKPVFRIHSKDKITFDSHGNRHVIHTKDKHHHDSHHNMKDKHHTRERFHSECHHSQSYIPSELKECPRSQVQVRIHAPDTTRKFSEPSMYSKSLPPKFLHHRLSPRTEDINLSNHVPHTRSQRRSWSRSPSPISANISPGYEQYQRSLLEVPLCLDYGDASSDDLSSEWDSDVPEPTRSTHPKTSGWRKLRNIVHWTPFFQTYKKQRYPWVQLAGHQGNFKAGPDQGTILKKLCPKEESCFQILMSDTLRPFVPQYKGQYISEDGESSYLQLQDLLSDFDSPCVMDCKVGVRTYLEEELAKAKEKPKLRKDMYDKMIQIDPNAPTDEEHRLKGVTKPRYMIWRETISSTATLGFRIEGVKKSDGTSSKDFKTTKSSDQVIEAFGDFIKDSPEVVDKYLERLRLVKKTLESSDFFQSHEIIGSSLLFVHDRHKASVWMIDFAKTVQVPKDVSINHASKWTVGNHEDGYMIGLENLIKIFSSLKERRSKETSLNSNNVSEHVIDLKTVSGGET